MSAERCGCCRQVKELIDGTCSEGCAIGMEYATASRLGERLGIASGSILICLVAQAIFPWLGKIALRIVQ